MAIRQSPYAKMYLVSPAIYGKLLSCLDDRDKAMAESLNPPGGADEPEEKRPSEQLLEQMHQDEINPRLVVQEPTQFITPQALQEGLAQVLPQQLPPSSEGTQLTTPSTQIQPQQGTQALLIPDYDVPSRPSALKINPGSIRIGKKKKSKLPLLPLTAYEESLPLDQLKRRREYPGWFSAESVLQEQEQEQDLNPPHVSSLIPQAAALPNKPNIIMPEIIRDPAAGPHKKPTIFMPEIMAGPSVRAALPNCVKTRRGTICNVATTGRVSNVGTRYACEYCGTTFGRKYDLKKHLLLKHGVEVEPSYHRWGIDQPDEPMDTPQGTKRKQSTAGITNTNPRKVTRISKKPPQTGSGCYPSWR